MGVSALSAVRSATTRSAQAAHSPADLPHTGNTVERMARDIGVVVGNLDDRGMAPGCGSHLDVEVSTPSTSDTSR